MCRCKLSEVAGGVDPGWTTDLLGENRIVERLCQLNPWLDFGIDDLVNSGGGSLLLERRLSFDRASLRGRGSKRSCGSDSGDALEPGGRNFEAVMGSLVEIGTGAFGGQSSVFLGRILLESHMEKGSTRTGEAHRRRRDEISSDMLEYK